MTIKAHSHRLRAGRYSEPGQIYLVTSRLDPTRNDFTNWRTGRLLVREMKAAQNQGLIHMLAWVVMPDHFHWLLQLLEGSLPAAVQRIKSKAAISVNRATGKQGRLWQGGFHETAVRYEKDLVHFARYIVANPLRAGLVKRAGDYALWDAIWLPGSGEEFGASAKCLSSHDRPEDEHAFPGTT